MRLQNWFYINVPSPEAFAFPAISWPSALSFPPIYLTAELIGSILPPLAIRPFRLRRYGTYAVPLGSFVSFFPWPSPSTAFLSRGFSLPLSSTATTTERGTRL